MQVDVRLSGPVQVHLDGPDLYPTPPRLRYEGANPRLLEVIRETFAALEQEILHVDAALFLFSCPGLARALVGLARSGARVRVFTTPLDGYHRTRRAVEDRPDRWSKHDVARRILPYFDDGDGLELRVFSHAFVRSSRYRRFERGSLPYSLHCKTIRLSLTGDREVVLVSSSNLSAVDETKDEVLAVFGPAPPDSRLAAFFAALERSSFPLGAEPDIYAYPITASPLPDAPSAHLLAGPFFSGSNFAALEVVRAHVRGASERLLVSAEHIAGGDFDVEASQTEGGDGPTSVAGPLSPLLSGEARPERVMLLSQTSATAPSGGRTPGNARAFAAFEEAFRASRAGTHHVAEESHMKFIVADDDVLVTSSNLTPTSFAYLPNVDLTLGEGDRARRFTGIHSEVGHWARFHSPAIADALESRMLAIASRPTTTRIA